MDEIGGDPGATFPANGLIGLFDFIDRNLTRIGHRFPVVHEWQHQGLLRASSLLLGLVGLLLLGVLPPLIGWLLRRGGRLAVNFRGERIPQSFGLVTLLWSCAMLGATAFLYADQRERSVVWLIGCAGFGLLGLLDDTLGTSETKGLRGHVRAAVREHRITTGFIKAVGGLGLAIWLAARLEPAKPALVVVSACVIALCANAVNLLDLRPGRAGAVFLVCALPLILVGLRYGDAGVPPLLLVAIPALQVWGQDASGRVMMGDTGSNLLGGALGLALVSYGGIVAQGLALGGLAGLHLLAERKSLTAIIQGNRFLHALDCLTGVR
jgi:UDP-GlcNAc:undecaprenyl-phosphate/decaprenyl-phosphate GlcNAc-1-phosphate transferase